MLSLKNSLKVLRKTNALLEGHFVLSSGLHSAKYIQCAKLLSQPKLSNKSFAFEKFPTPGKINLSKFLRSSGLETISDLKPIFFID